MSEGELEEKIIDLEFAVNRLKGVLRKSYVVKALLGDEEYRRKLYIVCGLLNVDLLRSFSNAQDSEGQVE